MARARTVLSTLLVTCVACLLPLSTQATPATVDEAPARPAVDTPEKGPEKGGAPVGGGTVGIRVSVSNIDPGLESADLDLTMYTRGYGPAFSTGGGSYVGYVGSPFFGYPALDFGDGSTLPTATLALSSVGGGPGGSNVYRSLASFSHVYPAAGVYTARSAMVCVICFQSSYVFFPPGSPVPTTFTQSFDLRPDSIIGNVPLRLAYSGTTYTYFFSTSVRYLATLTPVVTNTVQFLLASEIPTASTWGLLALAAVLGAAGLLLIRRG